MSNPDSIDNSTPEFGKGTNNEERGAAATISTRENGETNKATTSIVVEVPVTDNDSSKTLEKSIDPQSIDGTEGRGASTTVATNKIAISTTEEETVTESHSKKKPPASLVQATKPSLSTILTAAATVASKENTTTIAKSGTIPPPTAVATKTTATATTSTTNPTSTTSKVSQKGSKAGYVAPTATGGTTSSTAMTATNPSTATAIRTTKLTSSTESGQHKPKKSRHKFCGRCLCAWDKCSFLSQQIQKFTSTDDVWNGDVFRISKPKQRLKSHKVLVLRAAIIKSVPGFEGKDECSDLYIARHHFPRALLEFNITRKIKFVTTYLTETQVEYIAEKEDNTRGLSKCYLVSSLLKSIKLPLDDEITKKYGRMYVQAPLVPLKEVETFVTLLCSERTQRIKKRASIQNDMASELKKKKQKKISSDNKEQSSLSPAPRIPELPSIPTTAMDPPPPPPLQPSVPIMATNALPPPLQPAVPIITTNPPPPLLQPAVPIMATNPPLLQPAVPIMATNPPPPQVSRPSNSVSLPIMPGPDVCKVEIKFKYERYVKQGKLNLHKALVGDKNFDAALFLLRARYKDFGGIKLYDGKYIFPCGSVKQLQADLDPFSRSDPTKTLCEKFFLRNLHVKGGLCAPCYKEFRTAKRRGERTKDKSYQEGSTQTLASMSNDLLKQKASMQSQKIKRLEKQIARLRKKYEPG